MARADAGERWITSWATAHVAQDNSSEFQLGAFLTQSIQDLTIRQVIQTEAEGSSVRITMSNREGIGHATLGRVTLARTAGPGVGPAVEPGTIYEVQFDRSPALFLGPGDEAVSDPVPMAVTAGERLSISTYVIDAQGPYSGHSEAKNVGWVSPLYTGDQSGDSLGSRLVQPAASWTWIRKVDVLTTPRPVVVVLGDSVSDGFISPEVRQEWPGQLQRLFGDKVVVINNALDANVLSPTGCKPCGPSVAARFWYDALDLDGVTHVIVAAGSNDITQLVSAQVLYDTFLDLNHRARSRNVTMLTATVPPRSDFVYSLLDGGGWDDDVHGPVRHALNQMIRVGEGIDGMVEFDIPLRSSTDPDSMSPIYDSGDRLHPNAVGMALLAEAAERELTARM